MAKIIGGPTFGYFMHVILKPKWFNLNQVILCSPFPVRPAPHPRELPWSDPYNPQGLRSGLLHQHDGRELRAVGPAGEGGGCQTVQVSSQQKHTERKPIKRNITKALPEHGDLSHSRCYVRTRAATQSTGAINAWLSHYLRRHWITPWQLPCLWNRELFFHLTKPLIFIRRARRNLCVYKYDNGIKLWATLLQHFNFPGHITSVCSQFQRAE